MTAAVIGMGAACGFGHGKAALRDGLFSDRNLFSTLKREGREAAIGEAPFLGIEMPEPDHVLPPRVARTASFGSRVGLSVLAEAWTEAALENVDPERIGLVVGGSNLCSREQALAAREYADRLSYVPPRHGHMFLDTDLCGLCTSAFPIRGFSQTVGAASASGSVAIIEALNSIRSGRVDVCIALGALQDLSGYDLHAMRALGAMGSTRFADKPEQACRPMDIRHDGFLYGEACAALVLCRTDLPSVARPYGQIIGAGHVADGTRGPEPSTAGQVRAARLALEDAGLSASDIDYVNGHATSTPTGDLAELESYRTLGLHHARINATKSIIGHGLSAAGAIEVVATLLQMNEGRLHPTRNLKEPLDPDFDWVTSKPVDHRIQNALKFSFGFGGIDTALVIAASGDPQPVGPGGRR